METVRKQTEAWANSTNSKQRGVDWQFTIDDVRRNLKSVCPELKE